MIEADCDIAVLGSGSAGSLTALILQQIGRRVVLIDKAVHPRFAIGESSTPIANLVLRDLARRYDLPAIAPLAKYGSWQRAQADVVCGIKRGFSYFFHEPGESFRPDAFHSNELLVAASHDDEHSDTHWLRADVDSFFARQATAAGVLLLDRTEIAGFQQRTAWHLTGKRGDEEVSIRAQFAVDASGGTTGLAAALGIANRPERLRTHSRSIFSHFRGIRHWHDMLSSVGAQVADHPFYCDHAAQHHLLDGAWVWVLPFNNGVTSFGFAIDPRLHPANPSLAPADEWELWLNRYPSLRDQLADATIVTPPGNILATTRLQRRLDGAAGPNWAILPHAAGFIDPLHSSGIAHSLCGIERLVRALDEDWRRDRLQESLADYEHHLFSELHLVDELVSGCYATLRCFRLFAACSMLYFAAATAYERRRVRGEQVLGFLSADDPVLRQIVRTFTDRATNMMAGHMPDQHELDAYDDDLRRAIEPYNTAGLLDPDCHNMYSYTALPVV